MKVELKDVLIIGGTAAAVIYVSKLLKDLQPGNIAKTAQDTAREVITTGTEKTLKSVKETIESGGTNITNNPLTAPGFAKTAGAAAADYVKENLDLKKTSNFITPFGAANLGGAAADYVKENLDLNSAKESVNNFKDSLKMFNIRTTPDILTLTNPAIAAARFGSSAGAVVKESIDQGLKPSSILQTLKSRVGNAADYLSTTKNNFINKFTSVFN